jgi:transposase
VRTNLHSTALDNAGTVRSYKSLSLVERAFRCLKTVDLQIRPVYARSRFSLAALVLCGGFLDLMIAVVGRTPML